MLNCDEAEALSSSHAYQVCERSQLSGRTNYYWRSIIMRAFCGFRKTAGVVVKLKAPFCLMAALLLSVGADDLAHAQGQITGNPSKPSLELSDVLAMEKIDRVSVSPDGEWVATVIRRSVQNGDLFGRASYDVDPTRSDVWLISTKTGERRALTNGLHDAAGFWCATWSPDGRRLAMLSTAPAGREPRGGDNVRLYIWDHQSSSLTRLSDDAVMTQSRFGSAINKLDLRGGGNHQTASHACHSGVVNENAPFLWLDDTRLLAVTLEKGEISTAVDQYARRDRLAAGDADRLRAGEIPTVSSVASQYGMQSRSRTTASAVIRVFDVSKRSARTIGTVPAYPFRSGMTASVSPDGRRLAVLASVGAAQPKKGQQFPNRREPAWTVERRLGFAEIQSDAGFQWLLMPAAARLPLELFGWSPNSRTVAMRARSSAFTAETPLFVADAKGGSVRQLGAVSFASEQASADRPRSPVVRWVNDGTLFARSSDGKWSLLGTNGEERTVAGIDGMPAEAIVRAEDGSLIALVRNNLLRLDPRTGAMVRVAELESEGLFPLLAKSDTALAKQLMLLRRTDGQFQFAALDTATGSLGAAIPAVGNELIDVDVLRGRLLYSQADRSGTSLREIEFSSGQSRQLLHLNGYLNEIAWGETRLVEYKAADGTPLKAAVILPPGYKPGQRYPTLAWVYGGYEVRSLENDFLTDPLQPGLYNLQLYAAKGYVVVVPSMPLDRGKSDIIAQLPLGVMPAIDELIRTGITNPNRLGVFGQSFGGYSVYGLLGKTDRFKAGVAIAGVTELSSLYGEFDPTARGYLGIEHEKGDNWKETGQFGQHVPPWVDATGYTRNSPLTYVDRVVTPLLMIHGDADIRGNEAQAERFFYSLYAQGKTAELRRYAGESHGLAQSPANIRDAFEKTVSWFNQFLQNPADGVPSNN